MAQKSLHQIMNEIAGRVDALQSDQEIAHLQPTERQQSQLRGDSKNADPLSEIEAFIQIDSLLAQLHKQYIEAKMQRIELNAANGQSDPMAEIAMDMEDSAYCAFQTRYIELRQMRDLMAKAQRLMRESAEDVQREKNKEREKEFRNFIMLSKMNAKLQEENKQGGFEYAALLLIFNLVPTPKFRNSQPQYSMAA